MKIEKNKIIKISILSLVFIIILMYIYFSITLFRKNNIQANGLVLLSETSDIRYLLSKYHLKYGEYPKTDENILLNNKYICNYVFSEKKCESNQLYFKNYENNFIYESNLDGLDYSIKFSTDYDNPDMNCINEKDSDKKGCIYKLNSSSITVEK